MASPASVLGPGTVALIASGITCHQGPCMSVWRVACQATGRGNVTFTKPGANASVSIGFQGSFDIDLAALTNYTCSALLTVNDTATGRSGTKQATFEVGGRHSRDACRQAY